ncbi:MAG: diaminopimelate decarboxylase, partial [Acutalibacteraceae bacterium]
YTAVKVGFPLDTAFYHGNNKTDEDMSFAIDNKIGYFVIDNPDELERADAVAAKKGVKQKILIRITPGIDSHTFEAINTGKVDSKFGVPIQTGQAEEFAVKAQKKENLEFCGYHCHIGSQIFECQPFFTTADIMIEFIAQMRDKHGIECRILDLGSGFGIKYKESDEVIDRFEGIKGISEHIKAKCAEHRLEVPQIVMEPGRGIVGDACLTLYTAGSVKEITGYKNYVSIDGGMTDNPRYALYKAEHMIITANKADREADYICTIAGRCCESGDIIRENVKIAKPVSGDIIASLTTGAYNYSMASNYNRFPRPAAVMVGKDGEKLVIRRETLDDLVACDL